METALFVLSTLVRDLSQVPQAHWALMIGALSTAFIFVQIAVLISRLITPSRDFVSAPVVTYYMNRTISEQVGDEKIWMTTDTRKGLNLTEGELVEISICDETNGTKRYREALAVVARRNRKNSQKNQTAEEDTEALDRNEVEVSQAVFKRLFSDYLPESTPRVSSLIRHKELSGAAAYWFDPDPRARFQNRFAVYLSVGLTVVPFLVEFIRS